MTSKPFYTVQQLAERWELSEAHIRRLYIEGHLKTFRSGRTVRIPESEVQRAEDEWGTELTGPWTH